MFSCEFCENSKNTIFTEHLWDYFLRNLLHSCSQLIALKDKFTFLFLYETNEKAESSWTDKNIQNVYEEESSDREKVMSSAF